MGEKIALLSLDRRRLSLSREKPSSDLTRSRVNPFVKPRTIFDQNINPARVASQGCGDVNRADDPESIDRDVFARA